MTLRNEKIALFDMDGTLCDYELGLEESMAKLRSPSEPPYSGVPRDNAPAYLKARADLIRLDPEWWANLPRFKLGFDIWDLVEKLGYRKMILTQGPKRNPNAWTGKKLWIDRNLGQNVDITITRDKGLVYGKVLVDDWPEYIERWLEWRPRGFVVMPANETNKKFMHPQVIRYDGTNFIQVVDALKVLYQKEEE
jgi:FMN phosphatase YigB (HAD superfamily)